MLENLTNVQNKIEKIITKIYKTISKKTFDIKINYISIYLKFDDFINTTTIKLITNSIYETIIKKRFIKKSKYINSLKKLMNKFERKTKIKTQNMKKIISFAMSLW